MSRKLTVEEEDAKNLARCKKCANYVESYAEKPGGYMTRCLVWSYDPKIDGCRFFHAPEPLSYKKAIDYIKMSVPIKSLTEQRYTEYAESVKMAAQALEKLDEIQQVISDYERYGWDRINVSAIREILQEKTNEDCSDKV